MTRPYTKEDVLYARRCRGEDNPEFRAQLADNPLYCGPIGTVTEGLNLLMYTSKAGVWAIRKTEVNEWSRPLGLSTMHITARRMCNLIFGDPDLKSSVDLGDVLMGRRPPREYPHRDGGFILQSAADIAAQVGRVMLSPGKDSPKCVMTFSRGEFSVIVGAETWLDAHARLFHKCVEEARRRKLVAEGRLEAG
jgi:hypothetical protein